MNEAVGAVVPERAKLATRVAHPFIYEINTWVWLEELSARAGTPVDLEHVPGSEWDAIAELGFDLVWLMGVWERSPAGIATALGNAGLMESFRRALPDFQTEDVVGSPYCIRGYTVDAHLGGPSGLAAARAALAERGIGLMLDFVPNHVAPDHPWTDAHPEYFVRGATRTSRATRRRSCASAEACSQTAATRTSPPGPTSCS